MGVFCVLACVSASVAVALARAQAGRGTLRAAPLSVSDRVVMADKQRRAVEAYRGLKYLDRADDRGVQAADVDRVNGLDLVPAVEQYCAQLLWSRWLISTISSWAASRGDLICIRSPGGRCASGRSARQRSCGAGSGTSQIVWGSRLADENETHQPDVGMGIAPAALEVFGIIGDSWVASGVEH
jgi:hypothetical protein